MATFLEGVQRLARECDAGSGPVSVVGQQLEHKRLVDWFSSAYMDIQSRYPSGWRWLRSTFTISTIAGKSSYSKLDCNDHLTAAPIERLSSWRVEDECDRPRIYLDSSGVSGQCLLSFLPWENFKHLYRYGAEVTGYPAHISIDPQNNIVLGPAPNDAYVVTGDYYKSPQILEADGDVPEMPAHFHNMIVWKAMEDYGFFESAQEVISRGQTKYKKDLRRLESDQMPQVRMAGPLV